MRLVIATLSLALAAAAPAAAQSVGMQVVDAAGAPVGTIIAVKGDLVTLKTDRHEVPLGKSSFTPHQGKLLFGMTRAQVNAAADAAAEETAAQAAASLAAGAEVKGLAGTVVGIIDAIDSESATIKLQSGVLVKVPRAGIAARQDGVVVGYTAEQLTAAAAQSQATDSGGSE